MVHKKSYSLYHYQYLSSNRNKSKCILRHNFKIVDCIARKEKSSATWICDLKVLTSKQSIGAYEKSYCLCWCLYQCLSSNWNHRKEIWIRILKSSILLIGKQNPPSHQSVTYYFDVWERYMKKVITHIDVNVCLPARTTWIIVQIRLLEPSVVLIAKQKFFLPQCIRSW